MTMYHQTLNFELWLDIFDWKTAYTFLSFGKLIDCKYAAAAKDEANISSWDKNDTIIKNRLKST